MPYGKRKKGGTPWLIIGVIILVIVGAFVWLTGQNNANSATPASDPPTAAPATN